MKVEYETARLYLRVLIGKPKYARQVLDFYNRNRNIFEKYEPSRPQNFYTEKYHLSLLNCEYQLFFRKKSIRYWIYRKEYPDIIIGAVNFYDIAHSVFQRCSMGYKLDEAYWHQGYAKEALSFIIPYIFKEINMHRIEALVMPENTSSIHLLEALNFQKEGLCKKSAKVQDKWTDHLLYALINESEEMIEENIH